MITERVTGWISRLGSLEFFDPGSEVIQAATCLGIGSREFTCRATCGFLEFSRTLSRDLR